MEMISRGIGYESELSEMYQNPLYIMQYHYGKKTSFRNSFLECGMALCNMTDFFLDDYRLRRHGVRIQITKNFSRQPGQDYSTFHLRDQAEEG